jgi:UDP-N-acetylglucosamine 1-carboxyvinyltransferase
MADLIVRGGKPISGTVRPSGNKNAVLPMLCATLLTRETVTITNVPEITDVEKILEYFTSLGSQVEWDKDTQTISITHAQDNGVHTSLPTGIRSSVLLIAPTLRRFGELEFDTSSRGCTLGLREIDPHLHIAQDFGAVLTGKHPYELSLTTQSSANVWADYASVTATETFIMMAVTADGTSVLNNAASEPHVQEFCHFLNTLGAHIEGIGTSRLTIRGVENLGGGDYRVPDDHHEVATFLAIGGVSGGELRVETSAVPHMNLIVRQLEKLGLEITVESDALTVTGWNKQIAQPLTAEMLQKIEAAPWPYFPVDLLPQMIGVAAGCEGEILFWNKIYEGAMSWASDLSSFGVKTHLSDPHRLIVFGGNDLRPASVQAPYIIRVVVALFIVAIQIDGESKIKNADPIERAHPHFIERLRELGADVGWEED